MSGPKRSLTTLEFLVGCEQERRAAVPQIIGVECYQQVGTFQYRLKMFLHNVPPDQGGKDEIKFLYSGPPLSRSSLWCRLCSVNARNAEAGNWNSATTARRLRLAKYQSPSCSFSNAKPSCYSGR